MTADVCLILEGTYPYVTGGVSVWVHDLLKAQSHLTFHLVALLPDRTPRPMRFEMPGNVVGLTEVYLQEPDRNRPAGRRVERLVGRITAPLTRLLDGGGLDDLKGLLEGLRADGKAVERSMLTNSEPAWRMITEMYRRSMPASSFIDYFWSWRSLVGGLFATLLGELPAARLYHAVSTGYAGLMLARAVIETGRPGLLTEHGIYTNERRVEIAMADWLNASPPASLDIEKEQRDLRDLWIDAFVGYSHACYQACAEIITLYGGNQDLQRRDGAPPNRLRVIPNGVDYDGFSKIERDPTPRRPTIALIGRVVPIKDVKTYIRATSLLREVVPDLRSVIFGPTEEDPVYFRECEQMVLHLGLTDTLEFAGKVRLQDHLGRVDCIVLTSISEAQPLVILEAGSAGVPCVATDVGSCREILHGRSDEDPPLGPGGAVTPLSNPLATARELAELLVDHGRREACGKALQRRVERYYNKHVVDRIYRELYDGYLAGARTGAA